MVDVIPENEPQIKNPMLSETIGYFLGFTS